MSNTSCLRAAFLWVFDMSEVKKIPFHEQLANKIIEQLKQGTAPWQKPWGEAIPSRPYNATTGKEYRGGNSISLMIQPFSDPRWLTFNQANAEGYKIKKGSKGVQLQSLTFHKEQIKRDENGRIVKDEKGQAVKELVKLEKPITRSFTVFNAEQVEGIPALKAPERAWQPLERAEEILNKSGAQINHMAGDRAYYSPVRDHIVLPLREQFPDAEKYYATALHELGHWTGHESRLNRPLMNTFGTQAYAKEELRAEIASMMVGQSLGISHDPGQHVAYVGSWIKGLQEDPFEIVRACQDAEKIHDFLVLEKIQIKEQVADKNIELLPTDGNGQSQAQPEKSELEQVKEQFKSLLGSVGSEQAERLKSMEAGMLNVSRFASESVKEQLQVNFYKEQLEPTRATQIELEL